MIIFLILSVGFIAVIYKFLTWNFDYWKKKNIAGPKPLPLLGTFPNIILRQQNFGDDLRDIYRSYNKTENFVGVFLIRTPQLLILDPDLVHEIFVTAFPNFDDNDVGKLINPKKDPLIAKNPFILIGEEWRLQRSLISPGLTSSRIKQSYEVMKKVCGKLIKFIEMESLLHGQLGVNGKDLSLRFTAESLCDCVLGLKASSFSSSPLPISENVRKFAENNTAFIIFSILSGLCPTILNFYKAKFFPKDCEDFFMDLMRNSYALRYQESGDRQDILGHLMKIKEAHFLNENTMFSHTMTFLIDGLDTTATVLSHCLLMLAKEPECQNRLLLEIKMAADEKREIEFEKLNEMPYLDACIHESLRIYPPGLWSTKLCTKSYQTKTKNGADFTIEKGESIMIPIYALHHDSHYYPEPDKFTPERFLPQNGGVKKFKDLGVFLGFGDGPRTCLGMRFALVQLKAALSSIVKTYHIQLNRKTKLDYKLDPKCFLALHNGGVWLDFKKR